MNLTICVNHSMPQTGGSEIVTQQIAEHMTAKGINTTIISRNTLLPITFNGIKIIPAGFYGGQFLKTLENTKPDHVLVYSDYFKYWPDILNNIEKAKYKVTLIPVGFNAALSDTNIMGKFRKYSKYFNIVTHSDNYQDYKLCKSLGIPVKVIPNGIDKWKEFNIYRPDRLPNFIKKYKIDTDKIILCVSNFFPGKGQEHLPKILEKIYKTFKDFTMVFISSTVDFKYANILRERFKKIILKNCKFKYKFLVDIPRDDIVAAYRTSDVFVFPSQKEVAPLVILEAMAEGCPWVSMPVGNVETLKGGLIVKDLKKDLDNNLCYTEETYNTFAMLILKLLLDETFNCELGTEGINMINEELNWDIISEKYYNLFMGDI